MFRRPKKSKMRFWTTVSAMFVIYCGGPYGIEEVVAQSGPTLAIFGLLFMAVFWGIPGVLQNSELISAMPIEGGVYQWYKKSRGRYWGFQLGWLEWLTWMFDAALYPTLLAEYFVIFMWPDAPFIVVWGITLSVIWLSVICFDVTNTPVGFSPQLIRAILLLQILMLEGIGKSTYFICRYFLLSNKDFNSFLANPFTTNFFEFLLASYLSKNS